MNNIPKIIKEFEENFIPLKPGFSVAKDWTKTLEGTTANYMTLKSFLLSSLQKIRQETLEEVVREIEEKKKYTGGGTKEREMIYNSAISEIIKLIQENPNLLNK